MGSSPAVSTKTKGGVYTAERKTALAAVFLLFSCNFSWEVAMKRAFIIAAVTVLAAVSCTARGAGDVTASELAASSSAVSSAVSSAASEQSASSSTTKVDAAKYADSVTGLASYMGACG